MLDFFGQMPYLVVVLLLFASGMGAPIAEDIPLLLGGYWCGIGKADIAMMLPITFFAVFGADIMIYTLGRKYGRHVQRVRVLRRYLSPKRMAKAAEAFHKHGGKTLFAARFMPGLRAPLYFSAGTFKIPFWKLLVFDGVAALVSVPLWVLLAWHFADHIDRVRQWSLWAQLTLGSVVVLLIAVVVYKLTRREKLASAG
jgi:membrane protein DedA with SNARE-associated domain